MGPLGLRNTALFTAVYICIFLLGTLKGLPAGEQGDNADKPERQPQRPVCNTTQCKKTANFIQEMLNDTIDPCNNFYDYVCQKWINANPIPEDKSMYGITTEVQTNLEKELKYILGNETVCLKMPITANITHKILNAYQSCMKEDRCDEDDLEALRQVMRDLGVGSWPVLSTYDEVPDWKDTFTLLMVKLKLTPIFTIGVYQDVKNVTEYLIQMDQVDFDMPGRNQFLNQTDEHNSKIIDAYKKYIKGIAKLMTGGNMTEANLQAFADEVVNLETDLAKRSRPEEERRDYDAMYTRKTVSELQKELPQGNWLNFFNGILTHVNITIDDQESVVIWESEYYNSTLRFLDTVNRTTLHNYLGLKVVSTLGPHTSDKFRDLLFNFDTVAAGVKKQRAKWTRCVEDIQRTAQHALGRIYVEKMFGLEAKKEMDLLVTELKRTFHTLIENKTWMDDETRAEAIKKVAGMGSKIGYPDWLMNNTFLEEKYEYVKNFNLKTPYVTIMANLMENKALQALRRLHTYHNKTVEWHTGAAVVNAFYYPVSNDVTFPAGILQAPFYEYGVPVSFIMGGIGAVIGHEVTHAFDDTGSQFDAEGKLHNWWSKETRAAFKERAQCFIAQYGNITDDDTSLQLNGVNTQGENIADNGGLIGAFLTHKTLLRGGHGYEDLALPGLENMTGDQLFFISYAVGWLDHVLWNAQLQAVVPFSHVPLVVIMTHGVKTYATRS
ncbi:neprilysin-1-like isoform X2 [Ornithodoros turicata]|uniref:neprilysin-1-like isoform X2 n=1 Tax=Ornithodoros turicata TaxID=34597 RepID=UPI00313A3824